MFQLPEETLKIENIKRSGHGMVNSRTILPDISGLEDSIENGILQESPIVWKVDDDYILISGSCRLTAIERIRDRWFKSNSGSDAEGAPFADITVKIYDGDLDGAMALNIENNLNRNNLNIADQCESINRLYQRVKDRLDSDGKREGERGAQQIVASMLHVSQPTVSGRVSICEGLCTEAFGAMRAGKISYTEAKSLIKSTKKSNGAYDHGAQVEYVERLESPEKESTTRSKRPKTSRSKKDVEELRSMLADTQFADSGDFTLDNDHRKSLGQFLRWYFCEIDTEEMLFRLDSVESVKVEEVPEIKVKVRKRKKRIRVGE